MSTDNSINSTRLALNEFYLYRSRQIMSDATRYTAPRHREESSHFLRLAHAVAGCQHLENRTIEEIASTFPPAAANCDPLELSRTLDSTALGLIHASNQSLLESVLGRNEYCREAQLKAAIIHGTLPQNRTQDAYLLQHAYDRVLLSSLTTPLASSLSTFPEGSLSRLKVDSNNSLLLSRLCEARQGLGPHRLAGFQGPTALGPPPTQARVCIHVDIPPVMTHKDATEIAGVCLETLLHAKSLENRTKRPLSHSR